MNELVPLGALVRGIRWFRDLGYWKTISACSLCSGGMQLLRYCFFVDYSCC